MNRLKNAIPLFLFFLMAQFGFSQSVEISGTIVDSEDQMPLPGVNIVEKGSSNGTSTDFDGDYKLNVSSTNAVLVISFMGYKTQEVALNGRTNVNIKLVTDQQQLDEVVLIGFGTVKKSDLTGAVATISGEELKKQPISNVAEALTGRLAGVKVTSSEGSPDSEVNIRIRGGGSLTQDAAPLYIVDGFPVTTISDISPNDIESVTVLKDASSTAIYGSRGANGVILITTKSGVSGDKVSVSYDMFVGFSKIAKTVDVLNVPDFVKWQYEFALLDNDLSSFTEPLGNFEDIGQYNGISGRNWQREIYGRTGQIQSHNIGIRGSSDKINYNFSYTNFDQKAIMLGSEFKRENLSLNLKNKANDKIQLSFTMRYSKTEVAGGGANEQREFSSSDARLRHVIGYAPITIPGLADEDTDEAVASYLVNPFVAVADNDRLQEKRNYNILGGMNWKITDHLQFKSDFGFDFFKTDDFRFYGKSTFYVRNIPSVDNQGLPALLMGKREDTRVRNANTFTYDFKNKLGESHQLKILLGQENIAFKSNLLTSEIHAFPSFFNFQNAVNLTNQGDPLSVNNFNIPNDNLLSFFGRVNYDLKDKYLFTATFRADGSSVFLGDNKWGYFPSAAVGWKISEEDFLKDVSWLNAMKFRLSYGQAGNNNIPAQQTSQIYLSNNSAWINGVGDFWAPTNVIANPDLKWETTTTQNLGFDFEVLNKRLSGSIDAYHNVTKDLLLQFPTDGTGYAFQYRNIGETQNRGLEGTINIEAIRKEKYGLSIGLNIGMNRNRINSLGGMPDFGFPTRWASTAIGDDYFVAVGGSIGAMYGFQNDGRYEVSDFDYNEGVYTLKEGVANASSIVGTVRPGSMKLKDINGDGVVNNDDLSVIGDANPKHTGGIVINANAHNFDISAAFNWSVGNDVYNASKIEHTTATPSAPDGQFRNLTTVMADGVRWTNLDPATGQLVTDPAALEALNANTTMWSPFMPRFVMTDWAVEDGSFLRLNTLTLGYTLPQNFVKKYDISNLRFYATATNVFILTKYSGLDPEVNTRRQTPLTPSVDYSPYPRSRQIVFGLNLNF